MKQTLLLVDNQDRFLGKYADRSNCHKTPGLHHRAFVTMLFNYNGEVLLQKRKHQLFGNLWDLTCASHPVHRNGKDESYEEAAARALKTEMVIKNIKLSKIGGFNYFAQDGNNFCENEYCAILTGVYNGQVSPDSDQVYKYRWISIKRFFEEVGKKPSTFTPWAKLTAAKLKRKNWNFSMLK